MNPQEIYAAVTEWYSTLSSDALYSQDAYSKSVAQAFGYTLEDLNGIPTQSNLGLSCGNPLAIASLKEGETVVDLGSGAGFDIFLAAKKVGPSGRAIGVDMNRDMLNLAERNKTVSGATNVEFLASKITNILLNDSTADAIISNCVINLVPESDKQLVFNEMFRLLKPGGRVAVSDILAKAPLPEKLRKCAAAYVGCISGASLVSQYYAYFQRAGFSEVLIKDAEHDLNVYTKTLPDGSEGGEDVKNRRQPSPTSFSGTSSSNESDACRSRETNAGSCCQSATSNHRCCAMPSNDDKDDLSFAKLVSELGDVDLNNWVGSYRIFAVKPERE